MAYKFVEASEDLIAVIFNDENDAFAFEKAMRRQNRREWRLDGRPCICVRRDTDWIPTHIDPPNKGFMGVWLDYTNRTFSPIGAKTAVELLFNA